MVELHLFSPIRLLGVVLVELLRGTLFRRDTRSFRTSASDNATWTQRRLSVSTLVGILRRWTTRDKPVVCGAQLC